MLIVIMSMNIRISVVLVLLVTVISSMPIYPSNLQMNQHAWSSTPTTKINNYYFGGNVRLIGLGLKHVYLGSLELIHLSSICWDTYKKNFNKNVEEIWYKHCYIGQLVFPKLSRVTFIGGVLLFCWKIYRDVTTYVKLSD